MNRQKNYKEIYELLEKLCKQLSGDRYREMLKEATKLIANTPNSICHSNSLTDESSVIARITSHLASKNRCESSLFLSMLEEMSIYTEAKQRAPVLEFVLYMADSENLDHTNDFKIDFRNDISHNSHNSSSKPGESTSQIETLFSRLGSQKMLSTNSEMKLVPFKRGIGTSDTSRPTSAEASEDENLTSSNNVMDELIQDVIYACYGIQGKYLRKNVVTGEFKLDHIRGRNLNLCEAGMLLRYADTGHLHNKVAKFTDPKSDCYLVGLLGQGYMSALQKELTQYYGTLAMLQENLNKQRKAMTTDSGERLTLRKLNLWLAEPKERFEWLALISESCRELKGGALASAIHNYIHNGDPAVKKLTHDLLKAVCVPLQHMLLRWLLDGEIEDPNCEFFIEELSEVGSDRLWHEKYRIRKTMLPIFITNGMAKKILVIGKSINFLREVCQDKSPIKERDELKQCLENNADHLFASVPDTKLHLLIDRVYLNTSKKVLDIVKGPHRLLEHLHAMRNYLLLGQGDFINILMENLKGELDRPAKDIYQHDLFSIMATAIRSTTAQFEDPEVLNHLDVRLVNPFEGDSGWDIFNLRYTVGGPLSTILEPSMCKYQALFKPLWNTKHVEFILSRIWKVQMLNAKSLRTMKKDISAITYRLHLCTSEMINFIYQMQYYILFEVIECSWAQLLKRVQQAKALDDILEAHHDFLEAIRIGTFLDEKSHMLLSNLEDVFTLIMKLEGWQDNFYRLCYQELDARKTLENDVKKSELKGEYGMTTEKRLERDEELKIFEHQLSGCQKVLFSIGTEYESSVRHFLLKLTSMNDLNLQQFGIRLDFNEYYKKRDQRLNQPLTYEHMRMSMVCTNKTNLKGSFY